MPRGVPNSKAAAATSSAASSSSSSGAAASDEPEFLDIDILSAGTKPDMNTRKRLAAMLEDGEEKKKQKRGRGRPKKQEGKEPVRNINASETVYEIENILDVRWRGSQREYFISWKDYSDKVNPKWLLPVSRALLFGALALRLVVWGGHEADGDLIRLHATRVAPAGGTGTLV